MVFVGNIAQKKEKNLLSSNSKRIVTAVLLQILIVTLVPSFIWGDTKIDQWKFSWKLEHATNALHSQKKPISTKITIDYKFLCGDGSDVGEVTKYI